MKQNFDAEGFLAALTRAVEARKVDWRLVSRETGVSETTLSRMKAGRHPDAASLAALSAWAGLNPADYCPRVRPSVVACPTCHGTGRVTPGVTTSNTGAGEASVPTEGGK